MSWHGMALHGIAMLRRIICGSVSLSLSVYSFKNASFSESAYQNQEAIDGELPSAAAAQLMKVHRWPNLFTDADIKKILEFETQHSSCLGTTRRDADGFRHVDSPWVTSYLSTGGLAQKHLAELIDRLIDKAIEADMLENWGLLNGDKSNIRIRVVELHKVQRGGALASTTHADLGSLVTVDVMLSDSSDFKGGEFTTLEIGDKLVSHSFDKGDILVFPSHKYHSVRPVSSGTRRVMIMELWRGETRECAHRCLYHLGPCNFSVMQSRMDMMINVPLPTIDPW